MAFLETILPKSLLHRLVWSVVIGVVLVQIVGNSIWVYQIRQELNQTVDESTVSMAKAMNNTLRYLSKLPANYRLIALEQLREAGGSRFYLSLHSKPITVNGEFDSPLAERIKISMEQTLNLEWSPKPMLIELASPIALVVRENGTLLTELPDYLNSQHLILSPKPAPLLVVQLELEPNVWIYIATLLPDPFILDRYQPLTLDRLLFQGLTVITVLALLLTLVSWIAKPLARLSEAAERFGRGETHEPINTKGTKEYSSLALAFNTMEERIRRYIDDRERLFSAISHDLRTPITRLKLRTELIDDDESKADFEEDLEDLELMVKGALQSVKESDIHENHTDVDIVRLLNRLIEPMQRNGHDVQIIAHAQPVISAMPLALSRVFSNLLDNGIHYGGKVVVTVNEKHEDIEVIIRDFGPGISGDIRKAMRPYTRFDHGKQARQEGLGLGLSIAQNLVNAQGGRLELNNHLEGGLIATVYIPIA